MFNIFKKSSKKKPKGEIVKQYTLIVKKIELAKWIQEGWTEEPNFKGFHYAPKDDETVIVNKPMKIINVDLAEIKGKKIIDFSTHLGDYGMGGPGFFGMLIEPFHGSTYPQFIVYAVWCSGQYCLLDDRVIECHPKYCKKYKPLFMNILDEPKIDDLKPILSDSIIDNVIINDTCCTVTILKNDIKHTLVMYKNNNKLPPFGSGKKRDDAFDIGVIGDYILLQHPNGVLWV